MRSFLSALALFAVAGCVSIPKPSPVALPDFDPDQAAFINASGAASISGEAFLRTVGGDVKTCAGAEVTLTPATDHAIARIIAIYGNQSAGFRPISFFLYSAPSFTNEHPLYRTLMKTSHCDAAGKFKFEQLAAGDYFVTTVVTWSDGRSRNPNQGGALMSRVTLKDGETRVVQLNGY